MKSANVLDSDGNLLEEKVTTRVRDVEFTLSASILNTILKITNPPAISTPPYTNRDIFTTLKPNEEFPEDQSHTLSFKPQSMSPFNRVLWYIYSRNFVQKGGSFSHFSTSDYRFFTAFVKKHPLNLGHWVFQQMIKTAFSNRKASYFPFPTLVSVILHYYKIWHVGPPEVMKYPPVFGKAQLNLMKLSFEEGSGQSRAPSRSQARASHSRAQEAQSAPPPSMSANLGEQIRAAVDAAIGLFSTNIQFEMGKLTHELERANHEMIDAQEAMKTQMDSLLGQNRELQKKVDDMASKQGEIQDHLYDLDASLSTHSVTTSMIQTRVDQILNLIPTGSKSTFGTTSAPPKSEPSSPPFTFHTSPVTSSPPDTSTPIPDPSSIPTSTPTTEIFHPSPSPSAPSTEIFYPSPSTEVLNLSRIPSPVIILPPSHFEDDKGGEKEKDQGQE